MKKVLNCSNHNLTNEQIAELKDFEVVELPKELKDAWGQLTPMNYDQVCKSIIDFCKNEKIEIVHLAGFQPAIVFFVNHFKGISIYSYSKRISQERFLEDGTCQKVSVFKFEGFFKFK